MLLSIDVFLVKIFSFISVLFTIENSTFLIFFFVISSLLDLLTLFKWIISLLVKLISVLFFFKELVILFECKLILLISCI